jgi:hypothetical protein
VLEISACPRGVDLGESALELFERKTPAVLVPA